MKKLFLIINLFVFLFSFSQEKTITPPTVEKVAKYDIELNYGVSFPGKDYHTHSWEDNFASYSKPGIDVRASFLMRIWKNAGLLVTYNFLRNDFDFNEIKHAFEEKSDVYIWDGSYTKWYHHTFFIGYSAEIPLSKKFNLNLRIQPGLSHSKSPSYKVIGENPKDYNDFYIYQQFTDVSLSFALATGMGVKYLFNDMIYASLRSDLSFFSPKFEIEVNNDGRFYYKEYTPYITSFSISAGVGVKF